MSEASHMSCWPDTSRPWRRRLGRTGSQSSSAHMLPDVPAALSRFSHNASCGSSTVTSTKSVGTCQGRVRRTIRAVAEKHNAAPPAARPRQVPRKAEPTGPTCATRAVTLAAQCTRLVGYTPAPRTLSVQPTGYGSPPPDCRPYSFRRVKPEPVTRLGFYLHPRSLGLETNCRSCHLMVA